MEVATSIHGGKAIIQLHGDIDSPGTRDYLRAVNLALQDRTVNEIEVDLGALRQFDSVGCGLLLILRERARQSGKPVALARAPEAVKQTLGALRLREMFSLN